MWFLRHFLLVLLPVAALAQPLASPTGVVASDGMYSTKVGLAWEHVRDAKLYRIFRADSNAPSAARDIGDTQSILYFDQGTAAGATAYYWVRAENGDRVSPLSAVETGFKAEGKTSNFGPFTPLQPPPEPLGNPVTAAKVYLGKTLFWDEQLSSTRTVACGTCHIPRAGTADPRSLAAPAASLHPGFDEAFGTEDDVVGSQGVPRNRKDGGYLWVEHFALRPQVTERKAPSVLEAAFTDEGLFWDGRAGDLFLDPETGEPVFGDQAAFESQALEVQALMPLVSDVEMGSVDGDLNDVADRVAQSQPLALASSIPAALRRWIGGRGYPELFEETFGTADVTPVRIAMAIASYERTLFSDQAEIDLFTSEIRAEPEGVTRARGLFRTKFCDQCHRGGLLADNRFRFVGVRPDNEDIGRAEVTGRALDRGRFRTASLRNVALRAPYFHNGSRATLEDVVDFYNIGGEFDSPNKDRNFVRPLALTDQERADFVTFLNTLTDPRVASEAAPLFDRPLLYAESARVPLILDAEDEKATLEVTALEPPMLGNPNFTVGVAGGAAGNEAVLVIDATLPSREAIPAEGSFARREIRLEEAPDGSGFGSVSLEIPADLGLEGATLFGRWYVREGGGVVVSSAFRMTLFAPLETAPELPLLSTVSAASLRLGLVAPESIVSGFGTGLATATEVATTLPLPTTLAGVSVTVRDSLGAERSAPLFFVSPTQINYQTPSGAAPGEATVTVFVNGAEAATGSLQIAATAPAIFTANASGVGPAAALALRVAVDGSQSTIPTAKLDADRTAFVTSEIDLNVEGEQVFLILFGTGVRFRGDAPVSARIGGEEVDVLFAGEQPEFAGVDQINLAIPANLAGRGEVDVVVFVGDQQANTVRIRLR